MHKKQHIFFYWAMGTISTALGLLTILIFLTANASAESLRDPPTLDKHLIVYGKIHDKHLGYIARNFGILVTNWATFGQVQKIKRSNPNMIALMYKDIFGMHPYDEDWRDVNRQEECFLHDKLLGLRLKESYFGWYVMDIANKGWVRHYADYAISKLDALKVFNGIFADDVWKDPYFYRFYVDIKDEKSIVNAERKIVVKYPLWNRFAGNKTNTIRIRIDHKQGSLDYYQNGSYAGRTITPGTPLVPGTKVYVDYSASDPEIIRPPEDRITNWRSNMVHMLHEIKARLGGRLLIINSDDISRQLLEKADGMMAEGFGLTELKSWEDQVQTMDQATKTGKYYLAQIKIKDGKRVTRLPAPTNRIHYSLASFLIAKGSLSSFSVGINGYSTLFFEDQALNQLISDFEKVNALLGKAVSGPFVYAERKSQMDSTYENLITNGSFEDSLANWLITQKCLGTPNISAGSFNGEKAIHFLSDKLCGSTLMSDFIPVRPGTLYELGASAKAQNVTPGDSSWKSLSLIGRFYDIDRKQISDGIADLQFGPGSYDWKTYSRAYQSPDNAYFFRITSLGLYPTSTGEGWIDKVFLKRNAEAEDYKVYAREFERGIVLVNPSKAKHTVVLDKRYYDFEGRGHTLVELNQNSAAILFR